MRTRNIFLVLFFVSFRWTIFASEIYLDVEKVGRRKDNVLHEKYESNKIVITRDEIEKLGPITISDLLRLYGIDTYVRSNAQSDVSLYGGTFQQVAVLINGVNISDKQTAHHSLNIPINITDIEKIEIIKNSQTNLNGLNSSAGSVNIITKKEKDFISKDKVKISYGTNETFNFTVNKHFKNNMLSLAHENSSGHRQNTDYSNYNVFYQTTKNFENFGINYSLGYAERNFGAQDFYAVNRVEYENLKTILTILNLKYLLFNIEMFTDLMFRFNEDYYTTQRYNPQIYNNNHTSYIYSLNTKGVFKLWDNSEIILGVDNRYDELYSKGSSTLFNWKGMGNFYDFQNGLYVQVFQRIGLFSIIPTFRTDWYSRFGRKNSYGIDLEYTLYNNLKLFSSFSQSIRIPSYTELFYWDPNNIGDNDLKMEHVDNYSLGTKIVFKDILFTIKGFRILNTNLIDWVKDINATSWKINNIAESDTNGLDVGIDFYSNKKIPMLRFNTVILDKKIFIPQGKELKYADNWPEKYFSIAIFPKKFYGIDSNFSLVYKNMTKTNPSEFFLLDTMFSKEISNYNFFVKIKNLLDTQYEEIPKILQPRRQIFSGIEYKF